VEDNANLPNGGRDGAGSGRRGPGCPTTLAGKAHVTAAATGEGDGHRLGPRSARRTFPGSHDQVFRARHFVAEALGSVPGLDEVVLLVSELCTNALLHTASGVDGSFEVSVVPSQSSIRVEVRDDGSDQVPVLEPSDNSAENGRGLGLVEVLADKWGYLGDQRRRTVFFELGWKAID
jgi:anti-sigma regulatory factor (Ser/Thr protein kinase)